MSDIKVQRCDITLGLDQTDYHPGEKVKGHVHLKVKSSTKFINLRTEVVGIERDQVANHQSVALGGFAPVAGPLHFVECHCYYRHVCTLDGNKVTEPKKLPVLLDEGEREYKFEFPLAANLPPSFHTNDDAGSESKMMYALIAVVEYENGEKEVSELKNIFVKPSPINKSQYESQPHRLVIHSNKEVKRLVLLNGGHVGLDATIERTLLVPGGDQLVVPLEIDLSDCTGRMTRAHLKLHCQSRVHSRHQDEGVDTEIVTGQDCVEPIESKTKASRVLKLDIPPKLAPTLHLEGSDVDYFVEIDLKMDGCSDVSHKFSIIVAPPEVDASNSSAEFKVDQNEHYHQLKAKQFEETVCYNRTN